MLDAVSKQCCSCAQSSSVAACAETIVDMSRIAACGSSVYMCPTTIQSLRYLPFTKHPRKPHDAFARQVSQLRDLPCAHMHSMHAPQWLKCTTCRNLGCTELQTESHEDDRTMHAGCAQKLSDIRVNANDFRARDVLMKRWSPASASRPGP